MMRLRVLGTVEAWTDQGARIEIGHARRQCVLVALLMEPNQRITADQLMERVWGDQVLRRRREALHTYLSRLRRVLAEVDDVAIVRRTGGWELAVDPELVDLHAFRTRVARARATADPATATSVAEQALELWRGEAFTGLDTPWIVEVRAALDRERWAAQGEHADLALAAGYHARLLPDLASRAAGNPLDERVAAQYMLAMARSGQVAEALRHYQEVRDRLVAELGAEPGAALREAHHQILDADSTMVVHSAGASTPRQLPAPPRPFTGRTTELAALTAAMSHVEADTVVISAVGGTGGIGKTWLALHWAHENLERFPDGQLFVDLRGFSPDSAPLDPAAAVRGFLAALGVEPGRVPATVDAQAALYRSLAAERRMLIMLDNAADTAQLTPLLPGGVACTVLITSRHLLPGLVTTQGARPLSLDVLTDDESRELLTRRLGASRTAAEPDAVADLVRVCGGYPLALGIVAARAQTRPHTELAALAAELRAAGLDALTDDDATVSVPTILSWSCRALTDEQRAVFFLLGIAPGADIAPAAAADLTGLPRKRIGRVLRALEDVSLLSRTSGGRFRMHDLVRSYAADSAHRELPSQVQDDAVGRVLDFYLHTAHAADRLLDPHRHTIPLDPPAAGVRPDPLPDVSAAIEWLDAEHSNLLAAQRLAAARGGHNTTWHLASALTTFHARRGRLHDEISAWRAALAAAPHLSDPVADALAHRRLGVACAELGRHDEAVAHLGESIARTDHDPAQQAHGHRTLGRVWGLHGDDHKALAHATRSLELYEDLGEPIWQARSLNQVAWYTARLGDYDRAYDHCMAALLLHRRHDCPEEEFAALDTLGYIAYHRGCHHDAVAHYRRAHALATGAGDTYGIATVLDHIATPYVALGRHEQARAAWHEAQTLYRRQGREGDAERVKRQLDALGRAVAEG